jgi:hypothetical protein
MGGIAGLCVGFGGSVEYQQNDNPHFHGNLHLVSMYQYLSLHEIAVKMQENLVTMEEVVSWQSWVCREEYFDHDAHQAQLAILEKAWSQHNSDAASHGLCMLPSYLIQPSAQSLWRDKQNWSMADAVSEGAVFQKMYEDDVDFVLSRCHHHWHPKHEKSKVRLPLKSCRSKRGNKLHCKAGFPMTKRLTLKPKVICRGNCAKFDLKVSGRRNALGQLLSRRRDEYLSGTAPGFAAIFRDNTHTSPNYRVPLLVSTHDPDCKADCLTKYTMTRMTAAAQRAQRNTTGYHTGYI